MRRVGEGEERGENRRHASPDNFNRICPLIKTYVRAQRTADAYRAIATDLACVGETINDCYIARGAVVIELSGL